MPARALVRDYKRTRGRSTGDGWHRAASHLRTVTFRALNDLQRQYEVVDVDTFADAIDTYVWKDLKALTRSQAPGDPSPTRFEKWALMDDDGVDRLVINVVNSARAAWDHTWIERRRKGGSKGGARSRRGPQWAEAHLDRLRPAGDLYGLTVDQQARALGRSRSTVDRMRAELRKVEPEPRNVRVKEDLFDLLDGP